MLRRPADRHLTLEEIADDWSREIQPPRTRSELAAELGKSWWRGEFVATRGPTRLQVLQRLFENWGGVLTFWIHGEPKPQISYMQPACSDQYLPVPNAAFETWADGQCVAAYEVIAECWGKLQLEDVDFQVTNFVLLLEPDFTKWVEDFNHTRPEFWLPASGRKNIQPPQEKSRAGAKRVCRRGRSSTVRDAAIANLRAGLAEGRFSRSDLDKMPDAELMYQTGAKRTTAREARVRLLSE